ncbi:cytochrome P450 [Nocardia sp. NPDC059091]|uniref:cytochrome P450 n=1 Tax=unclassified Nocardia TaxID=2637762 RepID=UPI0036B5F94D
MNTLPEVLEGFDLTDQDRFALGVPHDLFARLRKHAPVLYHPAGRSADGEGFWVLSGYAEVTRAATEPAFSAQGGGGRTGGGTHLDDLPAEYAGVLLPMMDDPRHDTVKKVLSPAVTADAAARLEPELRAIAAELIDDSLARGTVEAATDLAEKYALRSVGLLLGAPRTDWDQLVAWGHDTVGFTNRRTGKPDDTSRRTVAELTAYAAELLATKVNRPTADLASLLAETDLSAPERQSNLALLILSGGEQPRNVLAEGILALARHPGQWQALRADRALLPTAIEEVLRWSPPNPYNRRTATRDIRLGDTWIRRGEKVTMWWPSANHDESIFQDPEVFNIRRNPNPHLTFGRGTHYCLGVEAARLELRVFLEELLDRVSDLTVVGPVSRAPSNKHSVILELPLLLD